MRFEKKKKRKEETRAVEKLDGYIAALDEFSPLNCAFVATTFSFPLLDVFHDTTEIRRIRDERGTIRWGNIAGETTHCVDV